MQRNTFCKSLVALGLAGLLPVAARAATSLKMLIPAGAGGGWDSTGRALGAAILESKAGDSIQYENKGGAAGTIGLAQFAGAAKADPNALLMMGAVMVGGIINSQSTTKLQGCTPIARLTSEYNVFVVPTNSSFKTMKDVVTAFKKDPAGLKWGGGSRGSTEHIAIAMLALSLRGIDPKKISYTPFRGGGEAIGAILDGSIMVGGGGYSEFSESIKSGKLRALAVTSQKRLPNVDIATMKEQGYDVILGNWRGVCGAPGLTADQQAALVDIVTKATMTKSWADSLAKHKWTAAFSVGKDFEDFVDYEFSSLSAIMFLSGMS